MSDRTLEVAAVALMLAAVASRNLALIAFGVSLLSLGIGTLALIRVNAVAESQANDLASQADALGDLEGRAAQVGRSLGGRNGVT